MSEIQQAPAKYANLKIDPELHRRLKRKALDNNETLMALAGRYLEAGLAGKK